MAARRLLLVTGSRSLAADAGSKFWADGKVDLAVRSLSRGDVVLAGGAPGPDTWAVEHAKAAGVRRIELRLDGQRYENGIAVGPWTQEIPALRNREWPLVRNKALVACAAKARDAGWSVEVLALKDPRSPTQGTMHTVVAAEAERLFVTVHTYVPANRQQTRVVWIDTETGGSNHNFHPVIEIGAVMTDSSSRRIISRFETKLDVPIGMLVNPEAAAINGYTPELWRGAPSNYKGMQMFLEWLPDDVFIAAGYNHAFDRRFIRVACERHKLPQPKWHPEKTIDPMYKLKSMLAKTSRVPNAKLDTICEHFGIENSVRHRALADAERARLVYLKLVGLEPESTIFERAV